MHHLYHFLLNNLFTFGVSVAEFCSYEMLPLEEQLEIAQQIGTTRTQIMSNLNELTLATSFL